ncbi:zinc finger, AN1-type domain [Coemansia sp. Cherry 401B]|nr:zinc finger, AN1-type domain [Coemansia sp. Cherry 401B]
MEFPDLGEQCNLRDCQELDFLPFTCQYCKKRFCEAHWRAADHSCARKDLIIDRQVPNCPICQQVVSLGPNEDPDTAVDRHISRECGQQRVRNAAKPKSNGCAHKRCKNKPIAFGTCPECTQRFCIPHLHVSDHECARRAASAPVGSVRSDMFSVFAPKRTATPRSGAPGSGRPVASTKTKTKDTGCICV